MRNTKTVDANKCPDSYQQFSKAIDELKMMPGIRPKVTEDFMTIEEAFTCRGIFAQRFVSEVFVCRKLQLIELPKLLYSLR